MSWEAESCRSAVGLEDEFTVHVLGFKSPISVCCMKLSFHKDVMVWFSFPVNIWVVPWAATVPGALHTCVRVCSWSWAFATHVGKGQVVTAFLQMDWGKWQETSLASPRKRSPVCLSWERNTTFHSRSPVLTGISSTWYHKNPLLHTGSQIILQAAQKLNKWVSIPSSVRGNAGAECGKVFPKYDDIIWGHRQEKHKVCPRPNTARNLQERFLPDLCNVFLGIFLAKWILTVYLLRCRKNP